MPDHHPAGYTTTQRNGEVYKVERPIIVVLNESSLKEG